MSEAKQVLEIMPVQDSGVVLMPVMNIQAAKARMKEFQQFVKEYLIADEDYGTIPGTAKPTLLKPGADKLCELYGLADDFAIESRIEDYSSDPPLFDYTIKCSLQTRRDGRLVGTGFGSCNSWEGKYRWRESRRKCPLCGKEAIIKGKPEYGAGWLCFKKKDGCGAKFLDGDQSIEGQKAGREVNDDIATLKNTILKMAKKRAKVDAVIAVTRSSGIFTQDMDDISDHDDSNGQGTREAAKRIADKKISDLKEKMAGNEPLSQEAYEAYATTPLGDADEDLTVPLQQSIDLENAKKAARQISPQRSTPLNLPPVPGPEPTVRVGRGEDADDVVGEIKAIKNLTTAQKRPYKSLTIVDIFGEVLELSAFDNFKLSDGTLFQYLVDGAIGQQATFTYVSKPAKTGNKTYHNIINVSRIGSHRWDDGIGVLEQADR